jgi:hypothetical protein
VCDIVRLAVILALALPTSGSAAGEVNSQLLIEAGQTFELGGGQAGGFAVTGKNTGPVAVVVLGKAPDKPATGRGTVAPGELADARVAAGEMALLINTSARQMARLKLKVTGDTAALGMTYSANP